MKEVGIVNSGFIPRYHSDEIALMTELVLDNSNPNLFPSSRRKSKIYGSDEEL